MINIDKLLRLPLYYQELLIKDGFLTGEDFLPENKLLKKTASIKMFEYSLLNKGF